MKSKTLGTGVLAAMCLLAPQRADALTVTTAYVPFKIFQVAGNNVPQTLTFQNFNAVAPSAGLTLTGVGFKIAGTGGTGSAVVDGNPNVANPSGTQQRSATVTWKPGFNVLANGSNSTALQVITQGSASNVPCVIEQSCPTLGGAAIPASSFRFLDLSYSFSGSAQIASLTGSAVAAFSSGVVTASGGLANFMGSGTTISTGLPGTLNFGFDPDPTDPELEFAISKPYIEGTIALEYQYTTPPVPPIPPSPSSAVPGPLPILGASAAFGWSRRIRKKIISAA